MIPALTLLLACQLAGEAVVRLLGWPVPGPVLGMALLLLILLGRDRMRPGAAPVADTALGQVTRVMLANLSCFSCRRASASCATRRPLRATDSGSRLRWSFPRC